MHLKFPLISYEIVDYLGEYALAEDLKKVPTPPQGQLELHYQALETSLGLSHSDRYEQLVVPNGNSKAPIHRWFHMKEAYSHLLFAQVLRDTGLVDRRNLKILDPFAGTGTTALAVAEAVACGVLEKATVYGVECNPFLHLVGKAKLRAIQHPPYEFLQVAQKVAASVLCGSIESGEAPQLSTFANPQYFAPGIVRQLGSLRKAIEAEGNAGANPDAIDLAKICLGAIVEPVSKLRRDGRALRYVKGKQSLDPIAEFLRRAEQIQEDLPAAPIPVEGSVVLGDGRTLATLPDGTFDLVLFSPPYPNNIDYTEVYKLEAWLLEYITDTASFMEQRLKTLHSHPSIKRETKPRYLHSLQSSELESLIAPILEAIPSNGRYSEAQRSMIIGYADDMLSVLKSAYRRMKKGAFLVYAVGNSLHGGTGDTFVIAADLLIAKLAELVGFRVESIDVARHLKRRGVVSPFLRESVVFARKG